MFYRLRFLLHIFIFFAVFSFALAQTQTIGNSGFVPGNIWFSNTPDTIGEQVKIYTMVWNASTDDLSGTVSFFDNDTLIAKQNFVLAGEGSSKILSVPWVVTAGYHKVYAQITDSAGGPRGKTASAVSLEYRRTSVEEHFIGTPAPANAGATTTAANFVDDKVNMVKDYAEVNLPKPVTGTAKGVVGTLENARVNSATWSDSTAKQAKKDLDALQKKGANSGGFSIAGPFKYAEMFLLSIMAYVLGSPWLTYAILVVVLFFILRFFKRKFFF